MNREEEIISSGEERRGMRKVVISHLCTHTHACHLFCTPRHITHLHTHTRTPHRACTCLRRLLFISFLASCLFCAFCASFSACLFPPGRSFCAARTHARCVLHLFRARRITHTAYAHARTALHTALTARTRTIACHLPHTSENISIHLLCLTRTPLHQWREKRRKEKEEAGRQAKAGEASLSLSICSFSSSSFFSFSSLFAHLERKYLFLFACCTAPFCTWQWK